MLVRFTLNFVTLLALTAGHRFAGLLALLNWVLILLAREALLPWGRALICALWFALLICLIC